MVLGFVKPKSRNPPGTVAQVLPVAWNPVSFWGGISPDAADPDEIIFSFIPRPVSRNPDYIFPLGSKLRGQFLDISRRFFIDNWIGLWIAKVGFSESFVKWPTHQDLWFCLLYTSDAADE